MKQLSNSALALLLILWHNNIVRLFAMIGNANGKVMVSETALTALKQCITEKQSELQNMDRPNSTKAGA